MAETKNSNVAQGSQEPWTIEKAIKDLGCGEVTDFVSLFRLVGRLKTTKREGWKRFVQNPESVADHSFRMALLTFSAPPNLDKDKCMKLALVHDLAESLVGDLTPMSGVPKQEKHRRELLAIGYISEHWVPEIRTLWVEFEAGESEESRYVQDLDKIELMLQALEYEEGGKGDVDLSEFFGVARKVATSAGQALAEDIMVRRKKFWEGKQDSERHKDPAIQRLHDEYYG